LTLICPKMLRAVTHGSSEPRMIVAEPPIASAWLVVMFVVMAGLFTSC
jgi:hypothetical protein